MNPTRFVSRPRFTRYFPIALAMALLLAGCGGGKGDQAADDKDSKADKTAEAAKAETGKDGKKKNEEKPVPVEIAQVAKRPIQASYHGTAALEAPNEAQVVAKTSGVLLQLLVEEGDMVKAGQVLARIDPDRPRLELQRADAMLKKLQAEMSRSKELFERKLVAADVFERMRYDVATQQAAYDMAKLELSYTNIVAPIDGVVAQRMVKQGNLIQLNSTLFRVVDARQLDAVLNVPEKELATLSAGLEATMEVDALPGQVFTGRIDRVSPVVDAGSGTFRVTVRFDSKDLLKPGMFGRVGVVHSQRADALTIPRTALLEDAGESAVFAVREGSAVRVPIQLGYVNGELAEVRSGLSEGDSVVTAGKVTLRDGSKVEVLNAPAKDDPAAVVAQSSAVAKATDKN